MIRPCFLFRLLVCVCLISPVAAVELHVSPDGSDGNVGTAQAPLKTLAAARDAAKRVAGKESVTVRVADGVYYLPETVVFEAADSGTEAFPIVYQAVNEGKAVLSGGLKLDLKWEDKGNGMFQASTPPGLVIDQLFIDGKRQRMARYPNHDPNRPTAAWQGYAADAFSKERAARWADPAGGYIHAMHAARWGGYHYRITGKKPDGNVAYEGGWQNNRQMGMHAEFRMVENLFEELDVAGEWFHDGKRNTLHYMPEAGFELGDAVVEVVRLRHLVEFKGRLGEPVRHVALKGFVFRHAARTFMDTKEPLLRSDWAIYRGGAVTLTGTENVRILDCEFDQVGGNAVFVNLYNRKVLIKGCHIHDAGASGVCFVGDPAAVRDPLFEYAQTNDLTKIDRTPGPKTENYPADSAVEDCLIHGIGRVERQPAGVQISMAYQISVRDTSIYDCARAGINVSEGTWGGHLIERCDVFDTVLETHDHGSFNSWGRDRFWTSNHRGVSQPEVMKDPKLPYLDAIRPTTIRDSRWRCDHGWDIDLDDGSSNYLIYNNLMLAGGLKFREGYGRKATNNIHINNGFHPHVWFDESASEFSQNIVMTAHAPIGQPEGWGKLVDRNLFYAEADRVKNLGSGGDKNSIAGDPGFVDAAAGDFRVREDSPAMKIGFRNFAMDQFGVKKPALRAKARTPEIPVLKEPASVGVREIPMFWLGAPVHGLTGEEFSAFGVSKEDGGVQMVDVPAGSAAERAGLKKNDLVQRINGRKISSAGELFAGLIAVGDDEVKLRVVRNQRPVEMTLPASPFLSVKSADDVSGLGGVVPGAGAGRVVANLAVNNDPLGILSDGKLAEGYGPVFSNGVGNGMYQLDLGKVKAVSSISSWSFNQGGNRGRQLVTVYGSASATDPGWNVRDRSRFVPLGSIDTGSLAAGRFTGASLRAPDGGSLGDFRWIVWVAAPISEAGENTAWQEFSVGSGD
jgi:hypothetical protein